MDFLRHLSPDPPQTSTLGKLNPTLEDSRNSNAISHLPQCLQLSGSLAPPAPPAIETVPLLGPEILLHIRNAVADYAVYKHQNY